MKDFKTALELLEELKQYRLDKIVEFTKTLQAINYLKEDLQNANFTSDILKIKKTIKNLREYTEQIKEDLKKTK